MLLFWPVNCSTFLPIVASGVDIVIEFINIELWLHIVAQLLLSGNIVYEMKL